MILFVSHLVGIPLLRNPSDNLHIQVRKEMKPYLNGLTLTYVLCIYYIIYITGIFLWAWQVGRVFRAQRWKKHASASLIRMT